MFAGTLSNTALIDALDAEISRTNDAIRGSLADFDPIQTPQAWHRILQGAEELINLVMEPWDEHLLHDQFVSMPLARAATTDSAWLKAQIAARYDDGMEIRVIDTLTIVCALSFSCGLHRYPLTINSVGDAAAYLQSRRRRWLALFYIMPRACRGKKAARNTEELFELVVLAEMAGGSMTDLVQMAMMARTFDDYTVTSNGTNFKASRDAILLDPGGLDPERVSVLDMMKFGKNLEFHEIKAPEVRRLLSKAEVSYQIELLEAAFKEFGLAQTCFGEMRSLVAPLLAGPEDYVVSVPAAPFMAALNGPGSVRPERRRALLVFEGEDYLTAINSYQPFVQIDDLLISNVNLLTRFLNDYKTIALSQKKSFQIRSGFMFEKKVLEVLVESGFTATNITRIDRSEFDVVTTKAGVIHNFQCKNTFIDTHLIENDPKRYARSNASMIKSYRRAIQKEIRREEKLKTKLGLQEIRHYVVSRFPVQTDDSNIIPFTCLKEHALTIV